MQKLLYVDAVIATGNSIFWDSVQHGWQVDNIIYLDIDKIYTLALDKAAAFAAIDNAVLAIYDRPMLLAEEYKARESDALLYKNANYIGTVPPRVLGFATPASLTPRAATDLILTQANKLRTAMATLSDLRMQKYAILNTVTDAESKSIFNSSMDTIATIAKSLA